jgi:hypothetical protein
LFFFLIVIFFPPHHLLRQMFLVIPIIPQSLTHPSIPVIDEYHLFISKEPLPLLSLKAQRYSGHLYAASLCFTRLTLADPQPIPYPEYYQPCLYCQYS